jgi:CTP synthase
MADQEDKLADGDYGGTMRLGLYPAALQEESQAAKAYKAKEVSERHRHRFEVNNEYIDQLEAAGLIFSGRSPDGRLMEIAELPADVHPFFVGTQFHPEFTARVLDSQPLFDAFISACKEK